MSSASSGAAAASSSSSSSGAAAAAAGGGASASSASLSSHQNQLSENLLTTVRALRLGTKQVHICREALEKLCRLLGANVSGTVRNINTAAASSVSASANTTGSSASSAVDIFSSSYNSNNNSDASSLPTSLSEVKMLRKQFQTNAVGGPGIVLNAMQTNGADVSVAELGIALMCALLVPPPVISQSAAAALVACKKEQQQQQQQQQQSNNNTASSSASSQILLPLAMAAQTDLASPLLLNRVKGRPRTALRRLVKKWVRKNGTRLMLALLVKHFDASVPASYLRGIVLPVCRLVHAFLLGDPKLTSTARLSGAHHVLTRIALSFSPSAGSVSLEALSIVLATIVSLSNVKLSLSLLSRNGLGVVPILALIRSVLWQQQQTQTNASSPSSTSTSTMAPPVVGPNSFAHAHSVARWCFRLLFYYCVVDTGNIRTALENNVVDVCIAVLGKCADNIASTGVHCVILDLLTLLLFGTPSPQGSNVGGGGGMGEARRRNVISHETERTVVKLVARAAVSAGLQNPREIVDLYNHLTKFLGQTELPVDLVVSDGIGGSSPLVDGSGGCGGAASILTWKPTNGCPSALLNRGGGESSSDDEDDDEDENLDDSKLSASDQALIQQFEEQMQRRVSLLFPEIAEGPSFRVHRETLFNFNADVHRAHYYSNNSDYNNNNGSMCAGETSSSVTTLPPFSVEPPRWSATSPAKNILPVETVPVDPLPDDVFCRLARNQFLRLVDPAALPAQVVFDNIPRSAALPRAYVIPPFESAKSPASSRQQQQQQQRAGFNPHPPNSSQHKSSPSQNFQHQQSSQNQPQLYAIPQLVFDANFECGNLKRVIRVGEADYDIITSGDTNTLRQGQWFYFSVRNMVVGVQYTFRFINFERAGSSFGQGNRPLMYSERLNAESGTGWLRTGEEVAYFKNSFVKPPPGAASSDAPPPSSPIVTATPTAATPTPQPSFPASPTTTRRKKFRRSSSENNAATTTTSSSGDGNNSNQQGGDDAGPGEHHHPMRKRCTVSVTSSSSGSTTSSAAAVATAAAAGGGGGGGGSVGGGGGGGGESQSQQESGNSYSSSSSSSSSQKKKEVTVQSLIQQKQTLNTLHFTIRFPYSNDRVFLCPGYPFGYTDMINHIQSLPTSRDCIESIAPGNLMIQTFCDSDSGLPVPILTITSLLHDDGKTPVSAHEIAMRPVCVVSARVHPGEVVSSFVARGLIDFLLDPVNSVSRALRQSTVWKIIPMLNPDGVVHGHYRCDLHGYDLNRMFVNPLAIRTPTIAYLNQLFKQIKSQGRRVVFYGDFHGHSKKTGCFTYACGSTRRAVHGAIVESIFPAVLHSLLPGFDPEGCGYKVLQSKVSTGRVVAFRNHDIRMSYTLEVSLMGGWRFAPISCCEDEEMIERDAVRAARAEPELVLNTPQSLAAIGAMFAKAFYCVAENFLCVKAEDLFRVDGDTKKYEVQALPRRGLVAETAASLLIAHAAFEKAKRVRALEQRQAKRGITSPATTSSSHLNATAAAAAALVNAVANNNNNNNSAAGGGGATGGGRGGKEKQQDNNSSLTSGVGADCSIVGPVVPLSQSVDALAALFPKANPVGFSNNTNGGGGGMMMMMTRSGSSTFTSLTSSPPPPSSSSMPSSPIGGTMTVSAIMAQFDHDANQQQQQQPQQQKSRFKVTSTTSASSGANNNSSNNNNAAGASSSSAAGSATRRKKSLSGASGGAGSSANSSSSSGGGGGQKSTTGGGGGGGGGGVPRSAFDHNANIQVTVAWGGKPKDISCVTVPAGTVGSTSASTSIISLNIHTPLWTTSVSPGGLIVSGSSRGAAANKERYNNGRRGGGDNGNNNNDDDDANEDEDDMMLDEDDAASSSAEEEDDDDALSTGSAHHSHVVVATPTSTTSAAGSASADVRHVTSSRRGSKSSVCSTDSTASSGAGGGGVPPTGAAEVLAGSSSASLTASTNSNDVQQEEENNGSNQAATCDGSGSGPSSLTSTAIFVGTMARNRRMSNSNLQNQALE